MAKFRTKTVEIEAVQWDVGAAVNGDNSVFDWLKSEDAPVEFQDERILIRSPIGNLHVDPLDWIIKVAKGEFYPCNWKIFEAILEPVPTPEPAND